MVKNIRIAYILSFLKTSWFWYGIWVFYYLRYTNYAGIGLIETVLIATRTVAEIPTGALADLLGRKNILILSFLFQSVGNFLMGATPGFEILAVSVFIIAIGDALYSGTLEALVFDTLKEKKEESKYDKILANINTASLVAIAFASTIGGFMYGLNPRLPFLAVGIVKGVGAILAFFLKEPAIDTEKFSLKNFLIQTGEGLRQLTKTDAIKKQTIFLLSISGLLVIVWEALDDILGVEFGFSALQLGIFFAATALAAAMTVQFLPKIRKNLGEFRAILIFSSLFALSFLVSPWAGIIIGGATLALRSCLSTLYESLASVIVNNNTESKFRATTISTFNMIKNLPYVVSAYFLGAIMDIFSVRNFAFALGTVMLLVIFIQLICLKPARENSKN